MTLNSIRTGKPSPTTKRIEEEDKNAHKNHHTYKKIIKKSKITNIAQENKNICGRKKNGKNIFSNSKNAPLIFIKMSPPTSIKKNVLFSFI